MEGFVSFSPNKNKFEAPILIYHQVNKELEFVWPLIFKKSLFFQNKILFRNSNMKNSFLC